MSEDGGRTDAAGPDCVDQTQAPDVPSGCGTSNVPAAHGSAGEQEAGGQSEDAGISVAAVRPQRRFIGRRRAAMAAASKGEEGAEGGEGQVVRTSEKSRARLLRSVPG